MSPTNKLTQNDLVKRAAMPKPHHSDSRAYHQWWRARVALGLPTHEPSMGKHAVKWRARMKRKRMRDAA